MLDKQIGNFKSDTYNNIRLKCLASTPEEKENVWAELVSPTSKLSLYQRRALMNGFFSWDQVDICEPYFDKFYDALTDLSDNHNFKYIKTFVDTLLPRLRIEDRHIVKLASIKQNVPDSNTMYHNLL